MQVNNTGGRYRYYYKFNSSDGRYDFEHDGLLDKLMSHSITDTNNIILRFVLSVIENSIVFISKYIDSLKSFKNYVKKNR